jgi:hypothetical protein
MNAFAASQAEIDYGIAARLFFPPGVYIVGNNSNDFTLDCNKVEILGSGIPHPLEEGGRGGTTLKSGRTTPGTPGTNFTVLLGGATEYNLGSTIKDIGIDGNSMSGGLALMGNNGEGNVITRGIFEGLGIYNTDVGLCVGTWTPDYEDIYHNWFNQITITNASVMSLFVNSLATYNHFNLFECYGNNEWMIYNLASNNEFSNFSGDGCVYNQAPACYYKNITVEMVNALNLPTMTNEGSSAPCVMFLDTESRGCTAELNLIGCGFSNNNTGTRIHTGLYCNANNCDLSIMAWEDYEELLSSGQESSIATGVGNAVTLSNLNTTTYYRVFVTGGGTLTLSGGATGNCAAGQTLYFKPTSTSVTFTASGSACNGNSVRVGEIGQPTVLLNVSGSPNGSGTIHVAQALFGEKLAADPTFWGYAGINEGMGWKVPSSQLWKSYNGDYINYFTNANPMTYYGTAAPTTAGQQYNKGDTCINLNVASTGSFMWICTTAGVGSASVWTGVTIP